MRPSRSLATILALLATPAVATPPDPHLAERVTALTRATPWVRVAAVPLRFRTFHPQGMVRIGSDLFLSSVEIRTPPRKLAVPENGHAYDAGAGVGHLFKVAPDGTLVADLVLGEGPIYHPGGIDFDGRATWVSVAEYRPDSRAIVYRVDPATMTASVAFRVADHIGGVVHDIAGGRIIGISWGSRRFYAWPIAADGTVDGSTATPIVDPQSYIDYHDCHTAGAGRMLCAGVAEYRVAPSAPTFPLGGLDLIDLATFRPLWQTPVPLWAPSGRAMTQNPVWMEATPTGLRAWFLPDDDRSTLFVYDAVTPTPPAVALPRASPSPAGPPADTASLRPHSGR